jgi:short-subunit dehydrogenase
MSPVKKVIITGASSGIGKDLAKSLSHDHHVYACGRNEQNLSELTTERANVESLVFDVTNKQQIIDATDNVDEFDLIVLNAGDCLYIDDPFDFDDVAFERVININLIAIGYCLNVLLPKLNAGGHIVFVGSSVTYFPFQRAEAYGASKAGLKYLSQSLRQSLAPKGYTVTLVEPGFVKTPLTDKNTFDMPFILSSEKAAGIISNGIRRRKSHIRFPLRLILLLKLFALLPSKWTSFLNK